MYEEGGCHLHSIYLYAYVVCKTRTTIILAVGKGESSWMA